MFRKYLFDRLRKGRFTELTYTGDNNNEEFAQSDISMAVSCVIRRLLWFICYSFSFTKMIKFI